MEYLIAGAFISFVSLYVGIRLGDKKSKDLPMKIELPKRKKKPTEEEKKFNDDFEKILNYRDEYEVGNE